MPNFLLDPGFAIYAALAVALVVWAGIFAFLWRVDRQAAELRRSIRTRAPRRPRRAPRWNRATLSQRRVWPLATSR